MNESIMSTSPHSSRNDESPGSRASLRAVQDQEPLLLRGRSRGRRMSGLAVEVRPVILSLVAMLLVTLAGWLYLEQATQVTEVAHEILALDQQSQQLRQEIVVLRAEIARLGALHRLQEEGERLGYTLPDADDASRRLVIQAPVPSTAASGATPPQGVALSSVKPSPSTLWMRVQTWWRGLGSGSGAK